MIHILRKIHPFWMESEGQRIIKGKFIFGLKILTTNLNMLLYSMNFKLNFNYLFKI